MNWEEIDKTCPKAYAKVGEWFEDNIIYNSIRLTECTYRWLYDFFDGEGIYIEFTIDKTRFWFDILDENNDYLTSYEKNDCHDTRTEAEEQSFTKAFEILEEKLT